MNFIIDEKDYRINQLLEKLDKEGINIKETFKEIKENRDNEQFRMQKLEKLAKDYNLLSNQMQTILAENAVLRQLAKVPDNFGEMVDDIKIEREGNINDFKRQIQNLENEIEELEEERARLKHKIRQMSTLFSSNNDKRYNGLSPDQMAKVDNFALNLKEGRIELPVTDKTRDLMKENERLKAQIEVLEHQTSFPAQEMIEILQNNLHNKDNDRSFDSGGNRNQGVSKEDIMEALQEYGEKMEDMFRTVVVDKHSVTPRENMVGSRVGGSKLELQKSMIFGAGGEGRRYPGGKYFGSPKPIAGMFGDMAESKAGYTSKFKSKIHLADLDEDYSSDMDIKDAKVYITALQLQNLENLEYIKRKEQETEALTIELEELKNGMKRALKLQDQLFVSHHQKLLEFDDDTKDLKETNRDLETTNKELNKKLELFENSLTALKSADPKRTENLVNELTKRSAIAETNVIKLSRKYASLEEEYKDLLGKWRNSSAEFSKKETALVERLEKLRGWKEEATQKMTILLERARNSVSLEVHRGVKAELELALEKYSNLRLREAELVTELSKRQGIDREFAEQTERIKNLEDEISASEVEIEVLQLRLNSVDPIFKKYSMVFRKMANVLKERNISPYQSFQMFDRNHDEKLSKKEIVSALKNMGVRISEQESEILFMFLDLDNSGIIDYKEFARKLKRSGVAMRSKEEETIHRLWSRITKSGLTLEQAFKVFDKDNDNLVDYNDLVTAMTTLEMKVEPRVVSELFKIADVTGDGKISNSEFIYVFKRYNKVSYERSEDTHLDWKYDVMARLDKVAKEKNYSLEDVFNSLDHDMDGKVGMKEMKELFDQIGVPLDSNEFDKLFYAIDSNKSGFIGFTEFLAYINRARRESERVSRARIIQAKKKQKISESQLTGIENDFNADPTTRFQLKVSMLEAKERSAQRQMEKMALKLNQTEEQLRKEEYNVKSLEEANVRTKKEYYQEKEKRTNLESRFQTGVSKEKAEKLRRDNEKLRVRASQLTGAFNTFRGLYEAAANEAKTLKMMISRDKDEINQLRSAVLDLQGESDEKALIGKMYKKNLNFKWSEANLNQRYSKVLDQMRKLKIENSDLNSKIRNKESELFEIQSVFTEKLMVVESQLKDARLSILPTVSLSRIEELASQVKRLAETKLELEIENKKLREENYENKVRVDNYILREKSLDELEGLLRDNHPDELSQRVIEITSKLSQMKLKELKSQRELFLVKEREEYYARVNRTQVDHIKKLESEISKYDLKYNEREEFWRKRYNEQLKMVFKEGEDNGRFEVNEEGKMVRTTAKRDIRGNENYLNKEMAKFVVNDKELRVNERDVRNAEKGNSILPKESIKLLSDMKERIRILQEDIKIKDQRIGRLRDDLKTQQVDINYKTNNIDQLTFGHLEAETKEMAQAAQQTILTLQTMLDEKNEELEQKEKYIDELKKNKLKNVKKMRTLELKTENLQREMLNKEAGRINMEHLSSVKVLQKLSSMNHKEMEKLILDYENRINILTAEMAECEKSNAELVNKLRAERLKRGHVENNLEKSRNHDKLSDMKKEIKNLTILNRKKNSELIKLKNLIEELKKDLLERDENIVNNERLTANKLLKTKTQTGETEMKLGVLTKKFLGLNKRFKEANDQIKKLKLVEIQNREKISSMLEENTKLKTYNAKMRDENLKLKKKSPKSKFSPKEKRKRRGSFSKPKRPESGKYKPKKLKDRDEKLIENLEKKIEELETINAEHMAKVKADFIDEEDKVLISTESSAFKNLEEIVETIRKYMSLNKQISKSLYPAMKRSDTKNLGVAKSDQFVKDLASIGIKFSKFDQKNFLTWLPHDKLGNIEYGKFYNMIKNISDSESQTEYSNFNNKNPTKPKFNMISRKERRKKPVPDLQNTDRSGERQLTMVQQERNVNLLKKRLDDKNKEIKKLQIQLSTWREKSLRLEAELGEKANKRRQPSIPGASSEFDQRVPTQTTALKMIKDLEEQVQEAKKLMNYEVEKREAEMKQMNETIDALVNENKMIASENETMRNQLEKIFSKKLTPNQLGEEKEKQRELLLSSLMAKLEKSRKREEMLSDKVQVLEKENIELKYIKEGIDTRIEGLNRKNKELKSSMKPYM